MGWFHYAFALTFLSLAFFRKRFDTDDFNLIKDIVPSLFYVSPVAPWNLQETIDPTNPSSSFLVKASYHLWCYGELQFIVMEPLVTLVSVICREEGIENFPSIFMLDPVCIMHCDSSFVIGTCITHWKLEELFMCIPSSNAILLFFISFNAELIWMMV